MKNIIFILAIVWSASMHAQTVSGGFINIGSGTTVVSSGSININNSGAIDNSGILSLTGNWINNSGNTGLVNNGGAVIFNGSVLQNIKGTDATAFNNLVINNVAGAELSAAVNASIAASLALTNGIFISDTNYIIILLGANVNRTNGWVNGNLQKVISADGAITYEVGDADYYAPADLDFTGVSSAGNVTVTTIGNDHPQILNSPIVSTKDANRYWTVTNNNFSPVNFTSCDITFHYNSNDLDISADPNLFIVGETNDGGATWTKPAVGILTSTTTQCTGIDSFGDFVLGMTNCTTPPTITCPFSGTITRDANAAGCTYAPAGGTEFDPLAFGNNCSPSTIAYSVTGAATGSGSGSLSGFLFNTGTSTVLWTVTAVSGSTATCSFIVNVNNPVVSAISAGSYGPLCENVGAITLSGTPSGGFFSGNGVSGNTFDPAAAGVGTTTVNYFYQDSNGCSSNASTDINVLTIPGVSTGSYGPLCSGGAPVPLIGSPSGGTFSGTSVSGNIFYPNVAGVGTYTVTYSYTAANGCSNFATTSIEVQSCGFVITATAGSNGSISPSGSVFVSQGASQTFFITPNTCYITSGILIDGTPVAAASSFTFNNVQATHAISVTFAPDPALQSFPATGISSNRSFNNICQGGSITLSTIGGSLAAGAQWSWYSGACGGTFITGGPSVTVSPTITTDYYVRAEGGTCNTATSCASITVLVSTGPPAGSISIVSAPAFGYVGASDTITATAVTGAVFYHWTSNGHDLLYDGQTEPYESTSPSVIVSFITDRNNYSARVYAGNACGRTNTASVGIQGSVAPASGITGNLLACANTSGTYISATIDKTKGYWWSITSVPANSATVSGDGNRTITVNFLAGFQSATLCVRGKTNNNTLGPLTCIQVSATPPAPSSVNGPATVCTGSTKTYTSTGAISYSWTTSAGTIIGSNNTSTVNIQFPGTSFTNAQVCAYAVACGNASATATCLSVSSTPGGGVGPVNGPAKAVCGQMNVGYDVPSNPLIQLYTWSVPPGATISNGQGSASIRVNFSNNFTPGNITALATYLCGIANASLYVSGAPAIPVIEPSGPYCPGAADVYNVSSGNTSTYFWNLSSSIEFDVLSYDSSQVFIIWDGGGTVQGRNSCGLSDPLILDVTCPQHKESGEKAPTETFRKSPKSYGRRE